MRILTIAPQPFFQPRGTPFSEFYRAKALIELGHEVDMVTYSIGQDVDLAGLRVFRSLPIPGVRSVPVGPSFRKIPLDALVFASAFRRLVTKRYDLLDCHEEAGLMGVLLGRMFRIPTVYDMHSSLPEQLQNFRFSSNEFLKRIFDSAERFTIRNSDAIIVICPHLEEIVSDVDGDKPCFLIENSPLAESGQPVTEPEVEELRRSLGIDDAFVVLYTGTFESYQGLPLLYESMGAAVRDEPSVRLLMVGGATEQVEAAKREVDRFGIRDSVVFTGQRPPEEMSRFLAAADALASPRSHGTNTPLKLYSYLKAGKPIVATRLLTHTQVLDDDIALLTAPTPEAFSEAIVRLARDRELGRRFGQAAKRRSDERYSYERYLERTARVLNFVSERFVPTRAKEKREIVT
jgi:glycosyltransferase involved in cell wall biosynthesis